MRKTLPFKSLSRSTLFKCVELFADLEYFSAQTESKADKMVGGGGEGFEKKKKKKKKRNGSNRQMSSSIATLM